MQEASAGSGTPNQSSALSNRVAVVPVGGRGWSWDCNDLGLEKIRKWTAPLVTFEAIEKTRRALVHGRFETRGFGAYGVGSLPAPFVAQHVAAMSMRL